jgi:hypothetical protein
MTDAAQYFNDDLTIGATGDLQIADSVLESQQRILRRLMTNQTQYDVDGNVIAPGDYLWHPTYGAGLPRMIGNVFDIEAVTALIRSQMYMEASVVQQPAPNITVTPIQNGVYVQIQYVEADSGQTQILSFDVTP